MDLPIGSILNNNNNNADSEPNSIHNRTWENQGVPASLWHHRRSYMSLSTRGPGCGSSDLLLHQIEEGMRGIKTGYTQKTGKVASHTRKVYDNI